MKHYYSKMTPNDRRNLREQMARAQGDECWYCTAPLYMTPPVHIGNYKYNKRSFPPNMLKYPVHLHHDHETDICLGAVHAKCNVYMWEVEGK